MNNKKNDTKLYNVLFPFWMLLLFPQVWLIVLPGNFIIDSLVLIMSMLVLKISEKKQFYKDRLEENKRIINKVSDENTQKAMEILAEEYNKY